MSFFQDLFQDLHMAEKFTQPDEARREIVRGMATAMGVHPIYCRVCQTNILYATQKIAEGAAPGWGSLIHWWDSGERPRDHEPGVCPQCDNPLGRGLRYCDLSEVFV